MTLHRLLRTTLMGGLIISLSACGGLSGIGSGDSGLFGGGAKTSAPAGANLSDSQIADAQQAAHAKNAKPQKTGTIWDVFSNSKDPNTTVEVNKYIWNAALEVLNFLPVQTVDPFTGVIVTGYGTPPGGGRSYRATIYVQDPALDARSLKLALQTRGGAPVSRETAQAVEDAILTRARQLRVRDGKL